MRNRASLPSQHLAPEASSTAYYVIKLIRLHFTDKVYSTVFGNFAKRNDQKLHYSNDAQNKQKYFQEKHRIKKIHKLLIS